MSGRLARATLALLAFAAAGGARAAADSPSVEVIVCDESGAALSGARTSTWIARPPSAPSLVLSTITDDEGGARLAWGEGAGARWLVASAPGFRVHKLVLDAVPEGRVRLALDRGASTRLHVTDESTHLAVEAIRVIPLPASFEAQGEAWHPFLAETLSASELRSDDGRFTVRGLPDEPVMLVIDAAGYAANMLPSEPGRTPAYTLTLSSRRCRDALVVDAQSGRPVPGARVAPSLRTIEGPLARLGFARESDAAGRVTLCPPSRAPFVFHATSDEHAPASIGPLDDDDTGPLEIRLRRGGAIEGLVLDDMGIPLPGCAVSCEASGLERRTRTDANGEFSFTRLPAGAVTVRATASDASSRIERRAMLADGESLSLVLGGGRALAVRVTEGGESPLPRALTVLIAEDVLGRPPVPQHESTTDERGVARFGDIETHDASLLAIVEGNAVFVAGLPAGREGDPSAPRELALPRRRVEGRIVDEATRAPLGGALVWCDPPPAVATSDDDGGALRLPALGRRIIPGAAASLAATDARGAFSLRAPARCRAVHVEGPRAADGVRTHETTRVPLSADDSAPKEIALEPSMLVEVSASAADGSSVQGALVALRRPGEEGLRTSTTLDDARVRLTLEDAGPWFVIVRAAGLAPAVSGPHLADAGAPLQLALSLAPGGFIAARPHDEIARVVDSRGFDWFAITDAVRGPDGGTLVGPLPAGRYDVHRTGGEPQEARIRQAGDIAQLE